MMLWLLLILPVVSVMSRSFGVHDQPPLKSVSDQLIELVTKGAFRGVTYNRLAAFADTVGPRLCGNESLTLAVDWVRQAMIDEGLDNVHVEEVQIPHWVRGEEWAQLLIPRVAHLSMLGLGNSVGTGPNGITAPVIVVRSFHELNIRCAEAQDKIVVFNPQCDWQAQPLPCYASVVLYRAGGASYAAKCGAKSCSGSFGCFTLYRLTSYWRDGLCSNNPKNSSSFALGRTCRHARSFSTTKSIDRNFSLHGSANTT